MEQKKKFEKPTMKYVPHEECVFLAASNETVIDVPEQFWDYDVGGGE